MSQKDIQAFAASHKNHCDTYTYKMSLGVKIAAQQDMIL